MLVKFACLLFFGQRPSPQHHRVRWAPQDVEDDIRRRLSVPNASTFQGNESEEL